MRKRSFRPGLSFQAFVTPTSPRGAWLGVASLVAMFASTACFGEVADSSQRNPPTSGRAPASGTSTSSSGGASASPAGSGGVAPQTPVIPAQPFGPAVTVPPAPLRCDELARSIEVPRLEAQHIWQHSAAGTTSVATGIVTGSHAMNELIAAGGGNVVIATYNGNAGSFTNGLVLVNTDTNTRTELLPLGSTYVRTGDYHHGTGRLVFTSITRSTTDVWSKSANQSTPQKLTTLPVNYADVRAGTSYTYAKGYDALWRISSAGAVESFAGAQHFAVDDLDETSNLFWSVGSQVFRVGSAAPVLSLTQPIIALGFDSKQKKLYAATSEGLLRSNADGRAREDVLIAPRNNAPGPIGNEGWMAPTGRGDIFADNGIVRMPVNCFNNADLADLLPYELDTNTRASRWLSDDPAFPFVSGTQNPHFDPVRGAHYLRR